jgi:CheY-specific phosphatase CheX
MTDEIRRAAVAAVSNVLENMFFAFAEEQREAAGGGGPEGGEKASCGEPAAKWVWGEIGLKGAVPGKITLALPHPLALILAANFLGMEEKEIPETELLDAVSELNNMISGNFFSLLDKKANYPLNRPTTDLISDEEKRRRSPETALKVYFNAEGHRVELGLQVPRLERKET